MNLTSFVCIFVVDLLSVSTFSFCSPNTFPLDNICASNSHGNWWSQKNYVTIVVSINLRNVASTRFNLQTANFLSDYSLKPNFDSIHFITRSNLINASGMESIIYQYIIIIKKACIIYVLFSKIYKTDRMK